MAEDLERPAASAEAHIVMRERRLDPAWVAVVLTFLVYGFTFVWWAAGTNTRVGALEDEVKPLLAIPATLARIDERTATLVRRQDHMSDRLDRLEFGPGSALRERAGADDAH